MAGKTYETIQGDTWDLIAYKLYGTESAMKYLIEANWPLIDVLIFSAGTKINAPELPEELTSDLPPWRDAKAEAEAEDNADEQFVEMG